MWSKLLGALIIWLLLVAVAWVSLLQRMPNSTLEWFALVVLGPPAYLVASLFAEVALGLYNRLPGVRHLHAFAERRATGREVSWLRVGVYLLTFSALFVGILFVASLLS